ncbi:LysR family transcriptional regulator [Streptomyces zaomyceticus]|uniref:LysR family transcriptional regulator n=1 Tax=Streptomyces zaomyceticus TaxID=68286 RepID=UPI0016755FAE|nr:LysR family transcriptional regulator [Streptomyces zaomyceticus]GHG41711.1 transcriptional regulator [Streptomyces zaomyceticus]
MDLELRHLRILLAISEAGSLTRAAAALFLSQPAMTTQLRRIEASFGQPLFERSACGVAPTRAGELVLAHARTAVASADRIRSYRLSPVDGAEPVTVGGSSGPILSHLTLHLPAAVTNPVTFVQFSSTGAAMSGVEDRSVDAGCMVDLDGFGVTPPEGVVVDVIGLEPVVVILPAGHPRARQDRVDLADLADETWLLPPHDLGCDDYGALADACAPAGFAPRMSPHRIGDLSILCDLVAQGVGVALAQGSARAREGVAMRRLTGDPLIGRHLLALHRDSPLFGARPLLLDLVRAAFEARCVTPSS